MVFITLKLVWIACNLLVHLNFERRRTSLLPGSFSVLIRLCDAQRSTHLLLNKCIYSVKIYRDRLENANVKTAHQFNRFFLKKRNFTRRNAIQVKLRRNFEHDIRSPVNVMMEGEGDLQNLWNFDAVQFRFIIRNECLIRCIQIDGLFPRLLS